MFIHAIWLAESEKGRSIQFFMPNTSGSISLRYINFLLDRLPLSSADVTGIEVQMRSFLIIFPSVSRLTMQNS